MLFAYNKTLLSSIARFNLNFLIKMILILSVILNDILNLNLLNKRIKIQDNILKITKIKKFFKVLKITIKFFFFFFLNFDKTLKLTIKLDKSRFVFILINTIKKKAIKTIIKKASIFIFFVNYASTARGQFCD